MIDLDRTFALFQSGADELAGLAELESLPRDIARRLRMPFEQTGPQTPVAPCTFSPQNWTPSIRDQRIAANTCFLLKQWGDFQKSKLGRFLDGRTWDQMR